MYLYIVCRSTYNSAQTLDYSHHITFYQFSLKQFQSGIHSTSEQTTTCYNGSVKSVVCGLRKSVETNSKTIKIFYSYFVFIKVDMISKYVHI